MAAMVDAPVTCPRWYRITPDRFVIAILAMVALMWLSERFGWFTLGQHKGWAVLIAVAAFAAALLLLVLWFVAAVLFRRRFQFGIRSLLLLAIIVALQSGWMRVNVRAAKEQHDTVEAITKTNGSNRASLYYDYSESPSPSGITPREPRWLRDLLGDDFFHDVVRARLDSDAQMQYLQGVSQLRWLELGGKDVTDAGMENVKGLMQLQRLNIFCTAITDRGLTCLGAVTSVRHLRLFGNNSLTSAMWVNLQHLPDLTDIDPGQIPITDKGLEILARLHNLRTLSLSNTGITDDGLKRLSTLTNLESLELSATEVTDVGLENLRAFTKLKSLGLQCTRLTDAGLKHLLSLPIERLDVSSTQVTDTGLEELKALSRLEWLSVTSHLLTATGVRHLQALPRLTNLSLYNVGDEDLDNLKNLSQLRTLNVLNPLTTNECMQRFQKALPNCKVNASYFIT